MQQSRKALFEVFKRALAAYQAGDAARARKHLKKVLAKDPRNVDAHHLMGLVASELGHHDAAVRHLETAIALNGKVAELHNNLGEAYRRAGDFERAVACYRRAIALDSRFAGAYNNLGVVLLEEARLDEAQAALNQARRLLPKAPQVLINLARLKQARGDLEGAVEGYKEALGLAPDDPAALNNLANAYQEMGRLPEALRTYERLLAKDPNNARALGNLALTLEMAGDGRRALSYYARAAAREPKNVELRLGLAKALATSGRWDEARAELERALAMEPQNADVLCELARLHLAGGRVEDALACYDRALAAAPEASHVHAHRAYGLMTLGRTREARAAYAEAVALDATNTQAWRALAKAKRFKEGDDDLAALEALAERSDLDDEKRLHLGFALAKAYEDIGDYDRAFAHLKEANRLKRKYLLYSRVDTERHFAAIRKVFTADFLARHQGVGEADATPIFIVGMPRSGTSLVEQILSSHSRIHGGGELQALPRAVERVLQEPTGLGFPQCCEKAESAAFRALGADYIEEVRRLAADVPHITDKLPYNFLRLGLIRIALPEAKIIHCRRHPLDTCLSIYKNYFMDGNDFGYDLEELAHFYRHYDALMGHWRALLGDALFEVRYEDLLADQEGVTRRLLAHCGLAFEPACVRFHETKRVVMTASVAQVREPIYKDSLALWKRYGAHLKPLIDGLGELGASAA